MKNRSYYVFYVKMQTKYHIYIPHHHLSSCLCRLSQALYRITVWTLTFNRKQSSNVVAVIFEASEICTRTRTHALSSPIVRAKTCTKLLLRIVRVCECEWERYSIRHAFSTDIINRLIIWQLGRALRQRRSVLCQANEQTAKRQQ